MNVSGGLSYGLNISRARMGLRWEEFPTVRRSTSCVSYEHYPRRIMSFITPDYFIHAANVLLLIAYSVRDVLWLRLFAVAASLIAIPFYVFQPTVLWAPLGWSVVFACINLFQSWLLFVERRPVKLTPEEEEIRRLAFQDLSPRKVLG